MERKDQEPFDREAWRRLLGADGGAPTKEIDLRILGEARRALAPRIGRWWLPASLAASLLLAVLIVQWQLADVGTPAPVTESDVAAAPKSDAAFAGAAPATAEFPAARQQESPKSFVDMPPPRADLPAMELPSVPAESASVASAAAAPAPAPAAEPAKPAVEDQSLLRNVTVTGERSATNATAAPAPAQAEAEADAAGALGALWTKESYAESRTPERWYAEIEALRAAGRIKEADAELARLKSKYPGWLEGHQKKDP